MNTPNKLTISRIILTFIFMLFLFSKGILMKILALAVFSLASLTDYYDGKLARKHNQVTDFGRFMDPLADKVLMIASFLAFVELKLVPAWMVLLIISRELVITSLRIFAATKQKILEAEIAGKHKTVSQAVAIFTVLVFLIFREIGMKLFKFWSSSLELAFHRFILVLMVTTVILTLISGISYLWRNRRFFIIS